MIPVIKNGVISKIEILDSGSGYQENISLKVYDNGDEHASSSRAILKPVVNVNGAITEIIIEDGGKDYSPGQRPLVIEVDYNGTIGGSGFKAGPVHTTDGIIEKINIEKSGKYSFAPIVSLSGGGHTFTEGEAVQIRVLSNTPNAVKDIKLIANGVEQDNRGFWGNWRRLCGSCIKRPLF